MKTLFDLTGKVAAVTGAGGVLCGQIAKALACAGAKVAVMDLSPEAAKKIADEIIEQGGTAIAVKSNVLDKKQIEDAAKEITAKLGKVDILVNGAGGNKKDATTSDSTAFFDLPA